MLEIADRVINRVAGISCLTLAQIYIHCVDARRIHYIKFALLGSGIWLVALTPRRTAVREFEISGRALFSPGWPINDLALTTKHLLMLSLTQVLQATKKLLHTGPFILLFSLFCLFTENIRKRFR